MYVDEVPNQAFKIFSSCLFSGGPLETQGFNL